MYIYMRITASKKTHVKVVINDASRIDRSNISVIGGVTRNENGKIDIVL